MKIWIVRHALAVDRKDFHELKLRSDSSRPLVSKGRRRSRKIFEFLKSNTSKTDLLLSSPYKRARQTAKVFLEVNRSSEPLYFVRCLEPDQDVEETVLLLGLCRKDFKSLMLFGHEPHLSRLLDYLIPMKGRWKGKEIKKSSVCSMKWKKSPEFLNYWTPKKLKNMK